MRWVLSCWPQKQQSSVGEYGRDTQQNCAASSQSGSALPAARDVLVLTARNRRVAAAACGELTRAA